MVKKPDGYDKLESDMREKYGDDVICDAVNISPPIFLPTGIAAIDAMLGGGWPRGRISELWGPEGSGKSTLCYVTIASAQRDPKAKVAYFDMENTFHPGWAKKLGVDTRRVKHIKAMEGEDMFSLILEMIRDKWALVIVDSIIEAIPADSLRRSPQEGARIGANASLLAFNLPKVVILQGTSPTVVLLVNQVRDKIGFFFGDSDRAPGGKALAHLDSVRVKVSRREFAYGPKKVKVGFVMALKVVKSKVGLEQVESRAVLHFGEGVISLDKAIAQGFKTKSMEEAAGVKEPEP